MSFYLSLQLISSLILASFPPAFSLVPNASPSTQHFDKTPLSTDDARPRLSVHQAVQMALAHSPKLQALGWANKEQLAAAENTLWRNPELRVTDLHSKNLVLPWLVDSGQNVSADDIELGLRWRPPKPGKGQAKKARAARRVEQTEADLRRAQRDLIAEVRSQHATLCNLDAQLALADLAIQLRLGLRELTQRRMQQQIATSLDQQLAELDYLDALSDREALRNKRQERYHAFVNLLGLAPDQAYQLQPETRELCVMPTHSFAELEAQAAAQQPVLELRRSRIAETQAQLSAAWLQRVPWFDFVQLTYVFGKQPGDLVDSDSVKLGFGIDLPIFNWGQQEVRGLEAKRARLQTELQASEQSLHQRLRKSFDNLQGLVALNAQHQAAQKTWVNSSEKTIRRAINMGEADLGQLARVQDKTLRAKQAQLRTALACQRNRIELERLIGSPQALGEE